MQSNGSRTVVESQSTRSRIVVVTASLESKVCHPDTVVTPVGAVYMLRLRNKCFSFILKNLNVPTIIPGQRCMVNRLVNANILPYRHMRKCCKEEINEIAELRNHTNDSLIGLASNHRG